MAAAGDELKQVFDQALRRYKKDARKRIAVEMVEQFNTVDDVCKYITKENEKFQKFRDKRKDLCDSVRDLLTCVQKMGEVARTALFPIGTCFAAVVYLVETAQGISAHYDLIRDHFGQMAAILAQVQQYRPAPDTSPLTDTMVDILAIILDTLALLTKEVSYGRFVAWLRYAFWKNPQKDLAALRERLREHVNSWHLSINISTHEVIGRSHAFQNRQWAAQVKEILRPGYSSAQILDKIRERALGTGVWLDSEPYFEDWMEQRHPNLWICGQPGFGKTYLAGHIISQLRSRISRSSESQVSVGYFFFSKTEGSNHAATLHQALRDITYQVMQTDAGFMEHVLQHCTSDHDVETPLTIWHNFFHEYYKTAERSLYLVLDGLDEIVHEGHEELSSFLRMLLSPPEHQPLSKISVLLLARSDISGIVRRVSVSPGTRSIDMTEEKTSKELSAYVRQSVQNSELCRFSTSIIDHIVARIEGKAKGFFLWAKLMLDLLMDCRTERAIRDGLDQAPEGIDDLITLIVTQYMTRLKSKPKQLQELRIILMWLTYTARPLYLSELESILTNGLKGRVPGLEYVLREQYGSLIFLKRDDGRITGELRPMHSSTERTRFTSIPSATEVMFAHAAIVEYFRQGKAADALDMYSLSFRDPLLDESSILKVCLQSIIELGTKSQTTTFSALETYAVSQWFDNMDHLSAAVLRIDPKRREAVIQLLCRTMTEKYSLQAWCKFTEPSFFSHASATRIIQWIQEWSCDVDIADSHVKLWVSTTDTSNIFEPALKIFGQAYTSQDSWPANLCLEAIYRIRCLTTSSEDMRKNDFSADSAIATARWIEPEENMFSCYRLGSCLEHLRFLPEAEIYLKKAVNIDPFFSPAQNLLASLYQSTERWFAAIECAVSNAHLLLDQSKQQQDNPKAEQTMELLSVAYSIAAGCYMELGNVQVARKYWAKSADTQKMDLDNLRAYLSLLYKRLEPEDHTEIILLLKKLSQWHTDTCSRLSELIKWQSYPSERPDDIFTILSGAAKSTGSLDWLESEYRVAIKTASTHITQMSLNVCLVLLLKENSTQLPEVETLIEEVAGIACQASKEVNPLLEGCKRYIAQDYCRICVRKAIAAGPQSAQTKRSIQAIEDLRRSGIGPFSTLEKVKYAEMSCIYLALLRYFTGDEENAKKSIRPHFEACYELRQDTIWQHVAMQTVCEILLALRRSEDAASLQKYIQTHLRWSCRKCRVRFGTELNGVLCQNCLTSLCPTYLEQSRQGKALTFCESGHVPSGAILPESTDQENLLWFRGMLQPLDQVFVIIKEELMDR